MVKAMKKKVAKKPKAAPKAASVKAAPKAASVKAASVKAASTKAASVKAASTKAASTKAASTKAASVKLNALDRLMMNMPHKTILKKYGAAAGLGAAGMGVAGIAGIVGLQKLQKKNPELFNRIFKVAMKKGPEPVVEGPEQEKTIWLRRFLGGIFDAKNKNERN
jgi:chemotaxis protein histidine kinase CheA